MRRESDDHDHGNHEECEGEEDEPRPILKRERTDSIWGEGCDEFFITAAALAALAVPSAAMADVTNNPSTNDSYGYATANANRLVKDAGGHGIGTYRSASTGAEVSNLAVNGSTMYPDWVSDQDAFSPISNNGK